MTKNVIRLTELDLHRVVKTCVKNLLQEAKDDNLHEFIQYIVSHGKRGELSSSCNKDRLYDKFMIDVDVRNADEYPMIGGQDNTTEWFYYDRGIDDEGGTLEWDDEIESDFASWCNDKATDVILEYIKTNNKNCIYIERAIVIPYFSNKDKLYKWFKKDYNGHLGVCWTYRDGYAEAYGGMESGETIILKGYVKPEHVNWTETITLCMGNVDEFELRLIENAPIQVVEIVTEEGNHRIFRGNLILQA